jgi:hypothetical protein
MTNYKESIESDGYYISNLGKRVYFEFPVCSPEVIAKGNALLDEIVKGAEYNNISEKYYIQEFM